MRVEEIERAARLIDDAGKAARLTSGNFRSQADLGHAIPFDSDIDDSWAEAVKPGAVMSIDAMAKGVIAAVKGPYAQAVSTLEAFSVQVDSKLTQIGARLFDAAQMYDEEDESSAETFQQLENDAMTRNNRPGR